LSTLSRTRPGENNRWVDPSAFLKPTLEEGKSNWLGLEWAEGVYEKERKQEESGLKSSSEIRFPSVYEIMVGIQE